MSKILVITDAESDLSRLIKQTPGIVADVCSAAELYSRENPAQHIQSCDAFAVLGGNGKDPAVLPPPLRVLIEKEIDAGKRIFTEYCASIRNIYCAPPQSTQYMRLVWEGGAEFDGCCEDGALFEDQSNEYVKPYTRYPQSRPVMIYKKFIHSHYRTTLKSDEKNDTGMWGMWFAEDNVLICNFRICNFIRNRFSPFKNWCGAVCGVLRWLTGNAPYADAFVPSYTTLKNTGEAEFETLLRGAIELGIRWFDVSGMISDEGKQGVKEGLHNDIYYDGSQRIAPSVRSDCTGETGFAFWQHYRVTGSERSLRIAGNIEDFLFDNMQIKQGTFKGMIRWTDNAWGVCYADDNARAIMGTLYKAYTGGGDRHLDDACDNLRFLARTTGSNGIRPARTDNINYTGNEEAIFDIALRPEGRLSPHYNAYYHAALLLGYKLKGEKLFFDTALRGLTSMMEVYPDMYREISETESCCRMVLALAWLYDITKEEKHKNWLYTVAGDLQKMRHPSGAYLEWDTGYSAALSRTANNESSLLSENGEPVVEQLYSVNWLPFAFSQAYIATGDQWFAGLWRDIVRYFISSQIRSENRMINGCWTRAFDAELKEVYAAAHDIGWGPWAVETGWTMADIIAGMADGLCNGLSN